MSTQMKVPYVALGLQHAPLIDEITKAVQDVVLSGMFIGGEEVLRFERRFAELCGTKHAVGVSNGTAALSLTMKGLGIGDGDEVITVSHSYLATASSAVLIGARPVFVDVGEDYNIDPSLIEAAITSKTRAIIPVHLTGRPAEMDALTAIAQKHSLHIIEDCAQAVGAQYQGQTVGSFGTAGCYSLHPLKNLSACGDGGVIVTNDDALADFLRKARSHGMKNRDECLFWSPNERLDALQAAILNVKLDSLRAWNDARRVHAHAYCEALQDIVDVPWEPDYMYAVYHAFVIRAKERDALKAYLTERGIDTKIHYPIPTHLQPAAKDLGFGEGSLPLTEQLATDILSLPVYPELTEQQRSFVIDNIREFYTK
ncbi:MAG TPA: DegT/DnrJ/EryC1/StrS family aminotransferase [Myxococcales bacterium]|nr:cell wall biogenesis protein [Deltaproteobacteria bacterium]MBU54174.1 cell wall biogenesis protein [Deltaproteobacteria bacterium]HAA54118.1 DegT/DnrJ/EryC1/StrS family aminotransferase [Myxococcales bacterium]|tara:strand:- start:4361 stop:5470 length:1110 start_codon:yes stop_codon:yes gene_type:complete